MTGDVLLTTSQAAQILGWSESSMRRLGASELPYTTTRAGHRRYRLADVEQYRQQLRDKEKHA